MFQFPTGWNSTLWHRRGQVHRICFNSQRDGILPSLSFILLSFHCFNSQRDGILPRERANRKGRKGFQFPTGWNSTIFWFHYWFVRKVSIPNGMEFYGTPPYPRVRFPSFQFPTGWNSTWIMASNVGEIKVSIPNGMEFYSRYFAAVRACACFNSQRDGILHILEGGRIGEKDGFNSQRDGILLKNVLPW